MLEELYFQGKLESAEGRQAAAVAVSGLSTPDGLVVGRLTTCGAYKLLKCSSVRSSAHRALLGGAVPLVLLLPLAVSVPPPLVSS